MRAPVRYKFHIIGARRTSYTCPQDDLQTAPLKGIRMPSVGTAQRVSWLAIVVTAVETYSSDFIGQFFCVDSPRDYLSIPSDIGNRISSATAAVGPLNILT
jgi:hypothetical protein